MENMKLFKLVFFLFISISVNAQNNGIITGKIVDQISNENLIGVNVIVLGTNFGASTNEFGEFIIKGIAPGNYQIKASIIGYSSSIKSDVIVNAVKPTNLLFKMSESIIELEGITVNSDVFINVPTEVNSIKNFSYEEIRRSPGGFEDVIRALSVLPGVARQNSGRNDLIVRGGAPSENLYLVDGFVVPNINHFGNQGSTGGPLSFINLDYVQETTFSTGGFQANYGNKLSSVLKIDLREAQKSKIGGKVLISASQFGFNLEGPINKKSNFLFSIRRSYLDFIFDAAGFNFVPEYYDLLTKYTYHFDASNKISYLFVGALDRVKFNNNDKDDIFNNARILGSDQNQYITGVSFQHLFNKGFYNIAISRNYINYDGFQNDTLLNPIFINNTTEAEHELKADVVYKTAPASEINIGGSLKHILYNGKILFPERFTTTFGETLPLNSVNTNEDYFQASIYGLYSGTFLNRFRYNFGLRGNYFNAINTKFTFSPRFSLTYLFSQITNISFSTGIYRQTPSYIWLVLDENKILKPIKATQYILGFSHLFNESIKLKIEGFYKQYTNYPTSKIRPYLVLANTGAGFGGSENNYSSFGLEPLSSKGKGFARGVEFSIQKKSTNGNLYGISSLTFSESKFTGLDGIEREGQYAQKWIFNFSGGYIFNKHWEASVKFRYASGSPYTPFNFNGTQSVDNYLSQNLKDTHALDVRVDRRWNFASWSLITYLDIQNIYNHKNVTQVRWDYKNNTIEESKEIGILPSIGINVEF